MTANDPNAREQRIRALAHHIWEAEGRPEGQSERHWAMAERLVEAEQQVEQGRAARAPKPGKAAKPPPARGAGTTRSRGVRGTGRDGAPDRQRPRDRT